MATLHGKSSCCGETIQRFGGRRRRCPRCGRTWRVRKRRCGAKSRRISHELVIRTLRERQPLALQAAQRGQPLPTLRKRFRRALTWFLEHSSSPQAPPGELALIVDGMWFRFGRERWTLYLLGLKPITADWVRFLDPVLLPGRECLGAWQKALKTIDPEVKHRIRAFISDGFRGCKAVARTGGWAHQRCHFHLIAQLHGRRGRFKGTYGREIREAIYQRIREALTTPHSDRLTQLREELKQLAHEPKCPKRFRMFALDFLRELHAFRTYQAYPQWHLPTTTNVVESMSSLLRNQTRYLNNPDSLRRWATAIIRLRPRMTCNGSQSQPK